MTNRLFCRSLILLLAFALILLYINRYTDIDLTLSHWMYSSTQHGFPWKDRWFAAVFMHVWIKYLLILAGAAVLVALLINNAFRRKMLSGSWRKVAVVALSFICIPVVISLLKSHSIHHCPWDADQFGGFAPYLRLFDALPQGIKVGHCFPAGHASSGL